MTKYGFNTLRTEQELDKLHHDVDLFLKHCFIVDRFTVVKSLVEGEIYSLATTKCSNTFEVYNIAIVTHDDKELDQFTVDLEVMFNEPRVIAVERHYIHGDGCCYTFKGKNVVNVYIVPHFGISNMVSYNFKNGEKMKSIFWLTIPNTSSINLFDRIINNETIEYYSARKFCED